MHQAILFRTFPNGTELFRYYKSQYCIEYKKAVEQYNIDAFFLYLVSTYLRVRRYIKRKLWKINMKQYLLLFLLYRKKIRLTERANVVKKLTCKGTLRQVFICVYPWTPYPPLHNVYVYTVYLFLQGRGGRVEPERRFEGQQFTKMGRKYHHDWMCLQSINSDKHLPQSPW
jgi:hypothetical protein